ncbi:MAG: DNA-3-methyladenine glycosylase I [Solirubrobacterales bacterium]
MARRHRGSGRRALRGSPPGGLLTRGNSPRERCRCRPCRLAERRAAGLGRRRPTSTRPGAGPRAGRASCSPAPREPWGAAPTCVAPSPTAARCRRAATSAPQSPLESKAIAKALKRRCFCFVGPNPAYSLMGDAGLVNDPSGPKVDSRELAR